MLRRDKDAQLTGADSTSAEETHPSPCDGFTPVTQWAEVRRPWQKTNEKWHLSEIPVETCSPPNSCCASPFAAEGPGTEMPLTTWVLPGHLPGGPHLLPATAQGLLQLYTLWDNNP